MNDERIRQAKGKFDTAAQMHGDLAAVQHLAEGLSILTEVLIEVCRDIEDIKAARADGRRV